MSASTPDPRALSGDERALIREALDLSILIYAPLAEVVAALKEDGCEHVTPLDHWEMQGVCFTRGERAFLVFRGTVTATDWLVDFFFLPLLWPLQHLGFGLGWRALRGDVMKWISGLPPEMPLFVTGHSLGGALAHVAAWHLAQHGRRIAHVITFGAPKFAWFGTARRYDNQSANLDEKKLREITLNVINKRDIVARVPPHWLGFQDVGQPIQNENQTWRFTDGVESHIPYVLVESADMDRTPGLPLMMPSTPTSQRVMPGLAKAATPDDGLGGKRKRNFIYGFFPPLRVVVMFPLVLYYTLRAAMDHPSLPYRGGFFDASENPRYSLKSESAPWTTWVILVPIGVVALLCLGWLYYQLVMVLFESIQRVNAALVQRR